MRGGHPGEEETVEASVQGGMPAAERRVEAMVARHGPALMRVANQFSLCHDDALDAYQRALEIYLRRLDTVEAATEGAWMRVVVKHEALHLRRRRTRELQHDTAAYEAPAPEPQHELDRRLPA